MVFSNSKFDSLIARPPTPPRDIDRDVLDALKIIDDPFGTKELLSKATERNLFADTTPPKSSPSSSTENITSSGKRRKRVNFDVSLYNSTSHGLISHHQAPIHPSPLRPLPPTRMNRPLKSILKPHDPSSILLQTQDPHSSPAGATALKFRTFAEMLEWMVKALAQERRHTRLDAYVTVLSTLKAYENVPDTKSLVEKLGLLTQFIRRDMTAQSPTGAGLDTQLVSQALKFLVAVLRIKATKDALNDEFCSYVLDRTITVGQDANAPKTVLSHHLAVLMSQNFRPRSMTAERVQKIVDLLQDIDQRVSGLSVHAYRLRIYRRLIEQAPVVMSSNAPKWFEILFKSMLSNQKDVRTNAIDTAQYAARAYAEDKQVSKALLNLLNSVRTNEETYAAYMCQRLGKMLDDGQDATMVPQIWGALTAFLRGYMSPDRFAGLKTWLRVLDKLIKSRDQQVLGQTQIAFNFVVYAYHPNGTTHRAWTEILKAVVLKLKFAQQPSWPCHYALLYYGLRPSASPEELERYWKDYVSDFWDVQLQSGAKYANVACRVLSALFGSSPRQIWNELRVFDPKPKPLIELEELPRLDAKWVRKQVSTILKLVEKCLDVAPWSSDAPNQVPAKMMWIHLMDSLVEASSQEIKASSETKDAIAHIVNTLRRLWDSHTSEPAVEQHQEDDWADKFSFLIETTLQKLGAMQFCDKFLSQNASDEFEVAPTPSHRSRHHANVTSPLLYLVDLMMNRSEGKLSDLIRLNITKTVLQTCLASRHTRLLKLELLKDCAEVTNSSRQSRVAGNLWFEIASRTKATMQDYPLDAPERQSRHLGEEYEAVVQLIGLGLCYAAPQSISANKELLTTFIETVKREAGEGAVPMAIVEPLSECISTSLQVHSFDAALAQVAILSKNLPQSVNRKVVEQGRKSLWTASPIPARTQDFDPYKHFSRLISTLLKSAYETFDGIELLELRDFLSALPSSIQHMPLSLLGLYLRKIQDEIALWVEDRNGKMEVRSNASREMFHEIKKLWDTVFAAIEKLPRKDSSTLNAFEPLLCAGFLSRRRGIVNVSIKAWNSLFGGAETLNYPQRLQSALQRLRTISELELPGFPLESVNECPTITFYESEDESDQASKETPKPVLPKLPPFQVPRASRQTPARPSSEPRKRASGQTHHARLRHDDSQVQFQLIDTPFSDPLNQESQVLTARQQEIAEKQRATAQMFPEITSSPVLRQEERAVTPRLAETTSQGAPTGEPSGQETKTSLPVVGNLGPMDYYLGSSPTPRARPRNELVMSDEMDMTTPTAVRTASIAEDIYDIPSSPPKPYPAPVSKLDLSAARSSNSEIVIDSFECEQSDNLSQVTDEDVDDDTDMEMGGEEVVEPEVQSAEQGSELPLEELGEGIVAQEELAGELPSSTVDVELSAQIAAEISAHSSSGKDNLNLQIPNTQSFADSPTDEVDTLQDMGNIPSSQIADDSSEIAETQAAQDVRPPEDSPTMLSPNEDVQGDSADVSRIGDSFGSAFMATTPGLENLRRSLRVSASTSPRKRKEPPVINTDHTKRIKNETTAKPRRRASRSSVPKDDDMLDCITVSVRPSASLQAPTPEPVNNEQQSSAQTEELAPTESQTTPVASSSTKRKRGRPSKKVSEIQPTQQDESPLKRRTRSSAVAESAYPADDATAIVSDEEETPAPKAQRTRSTQDVSEAKSSSPVASDSSSSQVKRLSHVRITPKRGNARRRNPPGPVITVEDADAQQQPVDRQRSGETAAAGEELAEPQSQGDTAATFETAVSQSQAEASTPSRAKLETPAVTPSVAARRILTPRSLLQRFKSFVREVTGGRLSLGSQESMEWNQEILGLQQEVLDAARRGGEGQRRQ